MRKGYLHGRRQCRRDPLRRLDRRCAHWHPAGPRRAEWTDRAGPRPRRQPRAAGRDFRRRGANGDVVSGGQELCRSRQPGAAQCATSARDRRRGQAAASGSGRTETRAQRRSEPVSDHAEPEIRVAGGGDATGIRGRARAFATKGRARRTYRSGQAECCREDRASRSEAPLRHDQARRAGDRAAAANVDRRARLR